jgi:hypothetical protein
MMRRVIAAVTLAAMLAGCTHVHPTDPTSAENALDDVNRAVRGRTVDIMLANSTEVRAMDVTVAADSTRLVVVGRSWPPASEQASIGRGLPTSEIRAISVTRRGKGALEGAGRGALIGFLSGAILGAATYEPPPPDAFLYIGPESAGAAAVWGGVLIGVVGLVVGLVWGAARGSKDVYDFTETPE